MESPHHVPVLLDRVVALLAPCLQEPGSVMVDATLGLGGHTEAVLTRCELARVIGIDRDPAALELARTRLAPYGDRFTGVHAVYDELPEVMEDLGLDAVDAVLFDLGVSSMQLDVRERGFAYAEDAPLDMRMDGTTGPDRRGRAEHLLGRGADPGAARLRRGAVRPQDRRRGRPPARERPVHDLGPAGRAAVRRDPGAGPTDRGTPGQAHVPGPPDGGQRRARGAAPCDPRGHRRDRGRRAGRRRVVPLARGPAGQAGVRRRHPLDRPRGPAVRARGQRTRAPPGHPRRRTGRRVGDRSRTHGPPRCGSAPSNASAPPSPGAAA